MLRSTLVLLAATQLACSYSTKLGADFADAAMPPTGFQGVFHSEGNYSASGTLEYPTVEAINIEFLAGNVIRERSFACDWDTGVRTGTWTVSGDSLVVTDADGTRTFRAVSGSQALQATVGGPGSDYELWQPSAVCVKTCPSSLGPCNNPWEQYQPSSGDLDAGLNAGLDASTKLPDASRVDRASFASPCSADTDCQLVREDCCGCTHYGRSTAVLKSKSTNWESAVSQACALSAPGSFDCETPVGCDNINEICTMACNELTATCDNGTCKAVPARNSPCGPGEFYYDDHACSLPIQLDGGVYVYCGPQAGDLGCYQRCLSDDDCHDPQRSHCGLIKISAGSDVKCAYKVQVCKATATDTCGVDAGTPAADASVDAGAGSVDAGPGPECETSAQCAQGLYCQFKYSADEYTCSKPQCGDMLGGCWCGFCSTPSTSVVHCAGGGNPAEGDPCDQIEMNGLVCRYGSCFSHCLPECYCATNGRWSCSTSVCNDFCGPADGGGITCPTCGIAPMCVKNCGLF